MYKKAITELPLSDELTGQEYIAIVQDGRTKKALIGEGVFGRVFVGDSPPADPYEGQLWFNASNSRLYSWNIGQFSSQWIQV